MTTFSYADAYAGTIDAFTGDFELVRSFVESLPQGQIVELGAGTGRLLKLDLSRNTTFVEQDPEMLALLYARLASKEHCHLQARKQIKVIEGRASDLPLPSESYSGAILSINTLAEMTPIAFTLNEIYRILQPGGKILIVNENPEVWPRLRMQKLGYSPESGYTYSLRTLPIAGDNSSSFITEFDVRKNDLSRVFTIRQELLDSTQLTTLLEAIGFQTTRLLGSFSGDPFLPDSSTLMIFEAKKTDDTTTEIRFPFLQEKYDSMAISYSQIVRSANYTVPDWLTSKLSDLKDHTVRGLDLGCGNGNITKHLKAIGLNGDFFGVDFSPKMIDLAREAHLYAGLLQFDLSNGFPVVENNFFDIVTACGILEFIPDPAVLLKCIHSVLAPHGRAFITFEKRTEQSPPEGVYLKEANMIKYYTTTDALTHLLRDCGFILIDLTEADGYVSPTLGTTIPYLMAIVAKA